MASKSFAARTQSGQTKPSATLGYDSTNLTHVLALTISATFIAPALCSSRHVTHGSGNSWLPAAALERYPDNSFLHVDDPAEVAVDVYSPIPAGFVTARERQAVEQVIAERRGISQKWVAKRAGLNVK
jgi:hypothetical protein